MPLIYPFGYFSSGPAETDVTWNPSDKGSNVSLTNTNHSAASSSSAFSAVRATVGKSSGKYYFEIVFPASSSTRGGIADSTFVVASNYLGGAAKSAGQNGSQNNNDGFTLSQSGTLGIADLDVMGFAVDMNGGYCYISKNNVWQYSSDPVAGTNPWISGLSGNTIFPACSVYNVGYTYTLRTLAASFTGTLPTGYLSWGSS